MKGRGLSAITIFLALVITLVIGSRYLKSQNANISNDIKSKLTPTPKEKDLTETKPRGLRAIFAENLKKQEEMAEKKGPETSNILLKERNYTEVEINEMTESEFRDLLKETESKLPTISDIRQLPPGALHYTPAPVMQAGKDLGLLKEILSVHESYEREAVTFYDKCAKTKERPVAIKALCLTNLIEIKKKNGMKINLNSYPKDIVELTKLITDI